MDVARRGWGTRWRLAAEVRHVLQQRPDVKLVVVQDGAPELRNLVDEWLRRERLVADAKLIDRFHVNERLAGICEAVTHGIGAARELYERWQQTQLDRSDGRAAKAYRSAAASPKAHASQ